MKHCVANFEGDVHLRKFGPLVNFWELLSTQIIERGKQDESSTVSYVF